MVLTKDHDTIRTWAAKNGAVPGEIHPITFDGEPAILTFLIGNHEGTGEIHPVSWETFFAMFDLLGLSLAFDSCSPRFELVRVEPQRTSKLMQ